METHMPRDEDRAKFVKLASARVSKALKDIQLIGNLANRSNYDYTDEDVTKIFRALNEEISACKKRFELSNKKGGAAKFTLD
jgi:predicted phosphohydrolase